MENPPIFNGKIHYKWPFSIAMLVHQRVILVNNGELLATGWWFGTCFSHDILNVIIPTDDLHHFSEG